MSDWSLSALLDFQSSATQGASRDIALMLQPDAAYDAYLAEGMEEVFEGRKTKGETTARFAVAAKAAFLSMHAQRHFLPTAV